MAAKEVVAVAALVQRHFHSSHRYQLHPSACVSGLEWSRMTIIVYAEGMLSYECIGRLLHPTLPALVNSCNSPNLCQNMTHMSWLQVFLEHPRIIIFTDISPTFNSTVMYWKTHPYPRPLVFSVHINDFFIRNFLQLSSTPGWPWLYFILCLQTLHCRLLCCASHHVGPPSLMLVPLLDRDEGAFC